MLSRLLRAVVASSLVGTWFLLFVAPSQDNLVSALHENVEWQQVLARYAVPLSHRVEMPRTDEVVAQLGSPWQRLVTALTKHIGWVDSVAVSPDMRARAVAVLDTQIKALDAYIADVERPAAISTDALLVWRNSATQQAEWPERQGVSTTFAFLQHLRQARTATQEVIDAAHGTREAGVAAVLATAGLRVGETYQGGSYVKVLERYNNAASTLRSVHQTSPKPRALLSLIHTYPLGWLVASLIITIACALTGMGWFGLALIVSFHTLLPVGFYVLADLTAFGLPTDKMFLLLRQYAIFSTTIRVPHGGSVYWWHGHTVMLVVIVASMTLARHNVKRWVENRLHGLLYGHSIRKSLLIGGIAAVAAISTLFAPGSGALTTDLLLIIAAGSLGTTFIYGNLLCDGLYYHDLRNAVLWIGLVGAIVVMAVLAKRGDTGAILLVASMSSFTLVLASTTLSIRLAALAVVAIAAAWAISVAGADFTLSRAEERILLYADIFAHSASDLARITWLMVAGGNDGFGGIGHVPWKGLINVPGGAVPVTTQSDYIAGALAALWGARNASVALIATTTLYLCGTALSLGYASMTRNRAMAWLYGSCGLFCFVVAARTWFSVCGTVGATPMTGIPIAVLAFAPASLVFEAVFITMAASTSGIVFSHESEDIQ